MSAITRPRLATTRMGATWQISMAAAHSGVDRPEALRRMTQRYTEHMHTNGPVHTWSIHP